MTKLVWDDVGERIYEYGLDRGVLYLPDGSGVPWNGLTNLDEGEGEVKNDPLFIDGVKYYDNRTVGEFEATLTAFTYPDEFEQFEGLVTVHEPGWLFARNQPINDRFGLSYRTRIGNDVDGFDHGYKLHILYNLTAVPDSRQHGTLTDSPEAAPFSWKITGVPVGIPGHRPTVHFIIDSRDIDPALLGTIEDSLYGTETYDARLLSPSLLLDYHLIVITDNGDGTWTAEAPGEFITMTNDTTFEISDVDATFLDATTYEVSTTG